MRVGRGGDQGVSLGAWIWHMKAGADACNGGVDGEYTVGEFWQDLRVHPGSQTRTLHRISTFDAEDADFEFEQGHDRDEEAAGILFRQPRHDIGVSLAVAGLSQFGDYIGVEQKHQVRFGSFILIAGAVGS
jgi:hypothetical protein